MATDPVRLPFLPADYQYAELTLVGTAALLMNSGEADRESDLFRDFTLLSQKRSKTLDDEARLRHMEWALRIYHDAELGPFIPSRNLKECLRSAATRYKKGEDVKRSLEIDDYRIPLLYEGPRDQDGLWEANFRYTAMAANAGMNRGRVARTRPMFPEWSIATKIAWDPEDLDHDIVARIVARSQKYGLGDFRPHFGSFVATLGPVQSVGDYVAPDGTKHVDKLDNGAHAASVGRVKKS